MKKISLVLIMLAAVMFRANADGYGVGDKAMDFRLRNVDGNFVSLADYKDARGFILVFTCNVCPYAVAYQDRIIELDKKYKPKGFPVVAVNPNDPVVSPGDSFDEMIKRSENKKFPFPYLFDEKQEVFPAYGAKRTPHVFLLQREKGELIVRYIGAIDNNYEDASKATERYVESSVEDLLQGKQPRYSETKAIGCTIKAKKQK